MSDNSYLIDSLAPLVFRAGKPFGSTAAAQEIVFPLPSSAAGLVRALHNGQRGGESYPVYEGKLENSAYQQLLAVESKGPFLVRFDPNKKDNYTILVPKPANALYFEDKQEGKTSLIRLSPKAFDSELCGSDLPEGLLPVQMEQRLKGKPQSGVAYWDIEDFIKWQDGNNLNFQYVETRGLKSLPIDIRTHVTLDNSTLSAEPGKLFQTASFDLGHAKKDGLWQGWQDQRYGFLVLTQQQLNNDTVTFGGERRLSYFTEVMNSKNLAVAPDLAEKINQAQGFSLSFLSPGIFAQGYLPAWIDKQTLQGTLPNTDVVVQLKAVAIDRWLPVSGWDSIVWKPKATRKAVSAGSVYWFELLNAATLSQHQVQQLWLSALADNEQDRRDGFGIALISPWHVSY